ncbi:MAG: hydroxyacid dehydrogenase [Acidimicrobiaceae bacterium]|nr:hydroxyacid dehydrogenase [Acidimicrobiaceae bacterium]MYH77808.1 hydroxyacid dehydrogenase [Acidimicrobiaceae bacterium]MYK76718.1 hydroxyacid dehydrogenase [Acidimicrobiaceae bacterium]
MYDAFAAAVRDAGGEVADLSEAEALIWADPYAAAMYPEVIAAAPSVEWVQLPYAGVEPFLDYLDTRLTWTCAKGVYADPVAEWVMAALLMGLRDFHLFAAADSWCAESGRNLFGTRITVLGGGGITQSLMRLLEPWGCQVTVVRRSEEPFEGADRTMTLASVHEAVAGADAVVVALALTDETRGVVNGALLESMGPQCWLVNVARGGHVDHAALETALRAGTIAGAVLDVTDPEPLPDDSGLWVLPNCVITPHIGNTREMGLPLITNRVRENVSRWLTGEELLGLVDVALGY